MRKLLFFFLFIMTLGLIQGQESSYQYQVALAQAQFDRGDYEKATTTLMYAFAQRSPRSKGLILALHSSTLAKDYEQTFAILDQGINSGWITLDQILSDDILTALHPRQEWQELVQKLIRFSNGTNTELRERIATLLERDQYYRQQMQTVARDKGWEDPSIQEMHSLQQELDVINLKEVEGIIEAYGYPGRSLVGNLSATALYIIQRADIETQEKYLPLFEEAAQKHEILRAELAYLVDKIRMSREEPQVYGTQIIRSSDGLLEFYPIEEPESVDKRRLEVDLIPLGEYAEKVGVTWTK
ncbi:MAG: DUF6624 domain-containing protein [Bacteroidota bacterium]